MSENESRWMFEKGFDLVQQEPGTSDGGQHSEWMQRKGAEISGQQSSPQPLETSTLESPRTGYADWPGLLNQLRASASPYEWTDLKTLGSPHSARSNAWRLNNVYVDFEFRNNGQMVQARVKKT